MKTWADFDAKSRDLWRAQEITEAALSMLKALQDTFALQTIAAASNSGVDSTHAIRFAAGVHEGLRLAISQLRTEPRK